MKIGIIGTGNMGRSLGIRWALMGHEVCFGARRGEVAAEAERMARDAGAASVQSGSNQHAASFCRVALYTPRSVDPHEVLDDGSALDDKVIIDCNNGPVPAGFAFAPISRSLAEQLQHALPKAHVVKAFNTLAQEVFEVPADILRTHEVSVFIAGDNAAACQTVATLARDLGFVPVEAGGLPETRLLDGLGDFIRYMIGGRGLGALTTVNVKVLPDERRLDLGGRRPSQLYGNAPRRPK